MTSIVINLTREAKHWTITLAVNGQIQPRAIFGCTEGLLPMVTGFLTAEAENTSVFSSTQAHAPISPSTIAVGMPSGRILTFTLSSVQETLAEVPEAFLG